MNEERILQAMTEISGEYIQEADPNLVATMPRKRRPLRIVLIAAAAATLMVTAAMALSPTFRDIIFTSLGFRAPYATEVLASCEDQGITIEAQSALTDGRMTRLYFTVHDPSGVFFLEDTRRDLEMDFQAEGDEVLGSQERLEQLSYDPEAQTALYLYRAGMIAHGSEEGPTHVKLSMKEYLPGSRWGDVTYYGSSSNSEREDRLLVPTDTLESTEENGVVVLLPEQNPQPLDKNCPDVSISSMGFASDGYYHIRLHQEPNVTQTQREDVNFHDPFDALYLLEDENGDPQQYDWDATIKTPVSDGWDYCLTALTQENLEDLRLINVLASYSVSGGWVRGDWSLAVPISPVECRTAQPEETLILSATKDSPSPSGENHEAQVSSVSVSPLGVAVDFTRPENYSLVPDVDGSQTSCTVTLAGGEALEPTYLAEDWGGGDGWVMWEFDEPIDPSQVVSVALNGNEISFPAK